ncbi:hypothetical protein nbrc107696_02480 [Gordonia spumicola]|uniref:SnoaL-like domain-containing protein n=1 Tax=Gordonia spumicola TaxID=589161 RepID=A0A7I9V3Q8_9ACTN|nr:nuclear transport factor 2 family protein [Gordonia spumicola]GED99801.1 hypothetical protein nbrc107696_02480 [Gordonia spumicola]
MPFDRSELDEMKTRWLDANIEAEKAGDWRPLAEFYTEDATYGWNYGPEKDFMAVGREEIREIALGQEMEGLEGWIYPYQAWVIDEQTGDMIGLWRQINEGTRADGSNYGVHGIGGSWFKYGGNFQFKWQRDFFDFGNVSALFLEMLTNQACSDGMLKRIEKSAPGTLPGWYPRGTAPVDLWDQDK